MEAFRLFWKDRDLGEVDNLSSDFPHMWANLRPCAGLDEPFRELFTFLVNEDSFSVEPPFAEDLLDDDNWWLVDGRGERWGISLPGVYLDDNTIGWRWRGEIPKWHGG